ncbi:MAG TPA: GNAT family N-acetyltransferase [Gammaproteobacteria bacterium]|nr:GNAT family N-acetyltransferase [Gammaproteobacteria bacterium]
MGIDFKTDATISTEQFIEVLTRSMLAERRPIWDRQCLDSMLHNASLLVTAWDGDRLVGVAGSLTDFHYACFISDLAVDVAYQRAGIDRDLTRHTQRLLGPRCKIRLISAPAAADYYAKHGFVRNDRCWELVPDLSGSSDAPAP